MSVTTSPFASLRCAPAAGPGPRPGRRRIGAGPRAPWTRDRGAATLLVVMLLFFIVSLTAAYTARNLVFEQRTAANQYRSSQAFEAAEAGLEWAMSQLNGGRIDANCAASANPADTTFRQRYVTFDAPAPGDVRRVFRTVAQSAPLPALAASPTGFQWAACVFDGTNWRCSCPTNGDPALTVPAGAGPFPAFAVRMANQTDATGVFQRQGIIRIEVNGCNTVDWDCLVRLPADQSAFVCRSTVCAVVALHGAVRAVPVATVTASNSFSGADATVQVANVDPASGGFTVRQGGATVGAEQLVTVAGSLPQNSRVNSDVAIPPNASFEPDCTQCLFTTVFGVTPRAWRSQGAVLDVDCDAGCTGTQINALRALHPGRPLWLRGGGGLTMDGPAESIGTAADPALLVLPEGAVTVQGGAVLTGLVFSSSVSVNSGAVVGAVVSNGNVAGSAGARFSYDPDVLDTLRRARGSFVRVPGSWRDLP